MVPLSGLHCNYNDGRMPTIISLRTHKIVAIVTDTNGDQRRPVITGLSAEHPAVGSEMMKQPENGNDTAKLGPAVMDTTPTLHVKQTLVPKGFAQHRSLDEKQTTVEVSYVTLNLQG